MNKPYPHISRDEFDNLPVITDKGKFQGSPTIITEIWDVMMNGCSERHGRYDIVEVGSLYWVLWEDDQGFAYCAPYDSDAKTQIHEEYVNDYVGSEDWTNDFGDLLQDNISYCEPTIRERLIDHFGVDPENVTEVIEALDFDVTLTLEYRPGFWSDKRDNFLFSLCSIGEDEYQHADGTCTYMDITGSISVLIDDVNEIKELIEAV